MQPRYQRAIGKYLLALPLQLERQHGEVLPEEEDLLQALGQQVLPPGVADDKRSTLVEVAGGVSSLLTTVRKAAFTLQLPAFSS